MRALILSALLAATPAGALDLTAMTAEERAAFRDEVKAYLLENPELLTEMATLLQAREEAAQAKDDAALVAGNAAALFSDSASFVGGNPAGSLTVVEFIDYQCGYCKKAHDEVAKLVNSDGDIRYVVKELPILGEQSLLASRFAIAALQVAGPDAYAKINAGFYESFRGEITEATLAQFATDLGIDPAPILSALGSPEVDRVIAENHALAQKMNIRGTPTFVIGEQMVRGYVPLSDMQALVAQERS